MDTLDPQHQAVRDAAAQLKAARYYSREPDAQRAYLDDAADLSREVAFILDQAGITWTQITDALDNVTGATAGLLGHLRDNADGQGVTEMALGRAVYTARAALDQE